MDISNVPRANYEQQWRNWLRTVIFIAQDALNSPNAEHVRAGAEVIATYSQEALSELARQQRERGNLYAGMRDLLWDATPGEEHPRERATRHIVAWTQRMEGDYDAR